MVEDSRDTSGRRLGPDLARQGALPGRAISAAPTRPESIRGTSNSGYSGGMDTATRTALRATGLAGDLARLTAAGALLWALIRVDPANIGRFAIVLGVLLIPRLARLARPFDAAFGWTLLLAAGASAAGWSQTSGWIDWIIHFVTTGAVAAMTVLVLARVGLMPALHGPSPRRHRAALVLLTTAIGFSIGVLWEFYEWIASEAFGAEMVVGYTDTIEDLAMDGSGSLLAGIALLVWAVHGFTRRRTPLGTEPRSRNA
jgi:hypothetical protein